MQVIEINRDHPEYVVPWVLNLTHDHADGIIEVKEVSHGSSELHAGPVERHMVTSHH